MRHIKHFTYFLLGFFFFFSATATAQQNTQLKTHFPYADSGLSDIWGYQAPDGREYALVGKQNGTSIVDVTDTDNPVEVFSRPGGFATWRDIKVWNHHAYVVDDQAGEGLIIIDLTYLPDSVPEPIVWRGDAPGMNLTTSHNIFIDEKGFAYLLGSNIGNGGALFLYLELDAKNPVVVGSYEERYVHDAFVRNDTLWTSEINNGLLSAVDISDKSNPVVLGSVATPSNFTHNCWLSDDGKTMFTTDEVSNGFIGVFDVSDVTDMKEVGRIQSSPGENVIPHNSFVYGNFVVTSYYTDGLTIHDATYPDALVQIGHYDTSPNFSGSGFSGAWGTYPYFGLDKILVADIEEGLYVISFDETMRAAHLEGVVTDASTGDPIFDTRIAIEETEAKDKTGFSGDYRVGIAEQGLYTVTFRKAGYVSVSVKDVALINGELATLNVALEPAPRFTLNGSVMLESGSPASFATIVIKNEEFETQLNTGADGSFSIPNFFTDNYNIIAGGWGFTTTVLEGFTIEETTTIDLQVKRGYYDGFALDNGWITSGTSNTGGEWVRVDPVGNSFGPFNVDPETGIDSDFGNECYITGDGDLFNFVSGGMVSLTSPNFDLLGYSEPYISYHLWFVNIRQGGVGNDTLTVKIHNGFEEVIVEEITSANEPQSSWTLHNFRVADFIQPTNSMKLTFEAKADDSFQEALNCAIDVFQVIDSSNVVGIEDFIHEDTKYIKANISPNPMQTTATVQLTNLATDQLDGSLHFKMFDLLGRELQSLSIRNTNFTINSQDFPAGIYFYHIENNDNSEVLDSGKFIVE